LVQRKSVLFTAQKVQEDGIVIATGFGNRAREMVEDVYGQVRPVWRHQANSMIPDRQAVSPFRTRPVSPSPARKAGKGQPYAFATPPRAGSKPREPESPRFGSGKTPKSAGKTVQLPPEDSSEAAAGGGGAADSTISITPVVTPRQGGKQKKKKEKEPDEPFKKGNLLSSQHTYIT
jgi:hypothetical protein